MGYVSDGKKRMVGENYDKGNDFDDVDTEEIIAEDIIKIEEKDGCKEVTKSIYYRNGKVVLETTKENSKPNK